MIESDHTIIKTLGRAHLEPTEFTQLPVNYSEEPRRHNPCVYHFQYISTFASNSSSVPLELHENIGVIPEVLLPSVRGGLTS